MNSSQETNRSQKRSLDQDEGHSSQNKRTKTTILSLPDECLRRITCHLSQKDTLSLLYSNSHFERACKVRLYRSIIICEKSLDRSDYYFAKLVEQKQFIVLTGFDNIKKFFQMFHTNLVQGKNPGLAKYVQEIITYDFLERDLLENIWFRSKSLEETMNYLKLVWDDVLNSFINLKVFIGPKLSLHKVFEFSKHITSNLQKLSISIENDLSWTSDQDLELPQLKSLKLNIPSRKGSRPPRHPNLDTITGFEKLLVLAKLFIINRSTNNTTLEELELNASFGSDDLESYRSVLESQLTNRNSHSFQSYASGFRNAISDNPNAKPPYCSNELDNESENGEIHFHTDGEEDEDDDNEEDEDDDNEEDEDDDNEEDEDKNNDEIFKKLVNKYREKDLEGNSIMRVSYEGENLRLDPYFFDNNQLAGSRNVNLQYHKHPTELPESEFFSYFIFALFEKNIKLLNLKRLSIVNMRFGKYLFEDFTPAFQNRLSKVIPNFHKLQQLDIKNVAHDSLMFDPTERDFIDIDEEIGDYYAADFPSLINFFTNHPNTPPVYENMKKLVFYVNPYLGDLTLFKYPHNPYFNFHLQLPDFFYKTPNLEELFINAPQQTKLKHVYGIINISTVKLNLKKMTYYEPQWGSKIASRILNARLYRKFTKHSNLHLLNEYYLECSNKIARHFRLIATMENSGAADELDTLCKNHEDTLFFKEEFLYLFGDDARRFFKICPKLEEFTIHGFTFERNKNIFV
ncbi:hypothetical protein BN7_4483 [Wickerhamomyces ciferrii]|uniref:F-box domain-containing protein n=1 Tax=Wickerhamomyces ciferrii (strain ATCC 14091 / BCRC 22168 / CBS 111 / JCM 3599 / NBRC 0793 / NRRL Y-1031 F-60-10) TaxID=1206466 RepID=K0KU26_WICCF|nr:uncharacterized protein BN7_4483 [Wickerhamomyces ciferrii]CCH44914.1 hypothetical protein BN7_4483 [Wickerhamomyces ciferrii]